MGSNEVSGRRRGTFPTEYSQCSLRERWPWTCTSSERRWAILKLTSSFSLPPSLLKPYPSRKPWLQCHLFHEARSDLPFSTHPLNSQFCSEDRNPRYSEVPASPCSFRGRVPSKLRLKVVTRLIEASGTLKASPVSSRNSPQIIPSYSSFGLGCLMSCPL